MPFAIILALGASATWGVSDYVAGVFTRVTRAWISVAIAQGAAAAAIATAMVIGQVAPAGASSVWLGFAAGVASAIGLMAFLSGLAHGVMSIVAPLAALGATVPVVFGIASGDAPSAAQLVSIVAALVGVMLVAAPSEPTASGHASKEVQRRSVMLGMVAALGFGLYMTLLHEAAGHDTSSTWWSMMSAKVGTEALLVIVAIVLGVRARRGPTAVQRDPRHWLPIAAIMAIAATGLGDAAATLMYLESAGRTNVGVAAMLSSLYPAVTASLAWLLGGERISRRQFVGVVIVFVAVLGMSGG